MLIYLAWDGAGFWAVMRKTASPPPRADSLLRLRLLGHVDGVQNALQAVEGLNAWLASRELARPQPRGPARVLPYTGSGAAQADLAQ
jgi:hypothetical protein